MTVKVVINSKNPLPEYATEGSAGMDLRADVTKIKPADLSYKCKAKLDKGLVTAIEIEPGGRALIPTGLHIQVPKGYEAMVRPRSGLALKYGVTVLNTPGCVDSDYTGDVGVILINHSYEPFEVHQGDKIAQLIISKVEHIDWEPVESLEETERGSGGFGHTGV